MGNVLGKSFFSPGKFILSGEHSVVYGYPALVSPLSVGVTVAVVNDSSSNQREYIAEILQLFAATFSKDATGLVVQINSELPEKSGFGSSAAVANAVLQALCDHFAVELSKDQHFSFVLEAEKMIHGNPSGADVAAVVHGQTLLYTKAPIPQWKNVVVKKPRTVLLIQSGAAQESTGEMVALVADKKAQEKEVTQQLEQMAEQTKRWYTELTTGSDSVFPNELVSENNKLLTKLGVVGQRAQQMIAEIEAIGGAAKVTGAGGVAAGSGWLLATHPVIDTLAQFAINHGWETQASTVQ